MFDCLKEEGSRKDCNTTWVCVAGIVLFEIGERPVGVFGEGRALRKSRSRPQAILTSLHWNKDKDGTKTIQLMVTIENLLDKIYWQIFVRFLLPPKRSMASLEKASLILGGFGWLGKGDSEKTAKLTFYMGKRQTTTCLAIS